jgi:hypothetical protein
MHTVTWTIRPNEGTSREDIDYELEASKADYADAPGLLRVILGASADNKSVIEISVWESRSAAEKFLSGEWETRLSRRWQAAPFRREDWDTRHVT